MTTQVHIVGPPLTVRSLTRGRVRRQRCLWCGALLSEDLLDHVASEDGRPVPSWEPGAVVRCEGDNPTVMQVLDLAEDAPFPDDACAQLDYEVTR